MKAIKSFTDNLVILFFLFINTSLNANDSKYINVLGDPEAPNTLVEYASLSCIHCANFHNEKLPKIKKELIDSGKLKYIYKDFPLDLPAMLASMICHCYEKEKYFTILDSLYRNQRKWVTASENKEKLLESFQMILKEHGITLKKIKECTADTDENKTKWESILSVRLEGQNIGVNSTPSFFLNDKKLDGNIDVDSIKKLIY